MQKNNLITGLTFPSSINNFKRKFCESCALAKSTRVGPSRTPQVRVQPTEISKPIISHTSKPTIKYQFKNRSLFKKWSMDLKGPIRNMYILIITDSTNETESEGASRLRFCYFLKYKSDTITFIIKFVNQLETLLSTNDIISEFIILKSDNGGEFTSNECKRFYELKHIAVQLTSPHTPHQNGVAERSNRTVAEMALTII